MSAGPNAVEFQCSRTSLMGHVITPNIVQGWYSCVNCALVMHLRLAASKLKMSLIESELLQNAEHDDHKVCVQARFRAKCRLGINSLGRTENRTATAVLDESEPEPIFLERV